jgi:hypothetical protein
MLRAIGWRAREGSVRLGTETALKITRHKETPYEKTHALS